MIARPAIPAAGDSRLGYLSAFEEVRAAVVRAALRTHRTIHQFAESEIIIPTGPHKGERFSLRTQPFVRILYDEIQSQRWNEINVTGPSQSGKTLSTFCLPILYYLFEVGEDVICGAPTMPMCEDKYLRDIFPVLSLSRYERLIPTKGPGARGGFARIIKFKNGATLRFMSGGGDDKSVAGYTSRVIVLTEIDGFANLSTSEETDKITQIETRAKSFGRRKMILKECTVSTEYGAIWTGYQRGTASNLHVHCQKCNQYVVCGRDSLQGWLGCETELDVEESAQFFCPACGEGWTEYDRILAVRAAKLVHKGQAIVDGQVVGDVPRTRNLGFRWTAAHNLLLSQAELGVEEWQANQEGNTENVERKMHQFVWVEPYKDPDIETEELDAKAVARRQDVYTRGMVPPGCDWITAGIDVQKRFLYWTITGTWKDEDRHHVIDYGRDEVDTDNLGLDQALAESFLQLRERFEMGWSGQPLARILVDAGAFTEQVYAFLQDAGTDRKRWLGSLGRGHNQRFSRHYNTPSRTTAIVRRIYDGCHLKLVKARRVFVVEYHSDLTKSRVHAGLRNKAGDDKGCRITLFHGLPNDHMPFTKQLAAEKQGSKYIPGKGQCIVWETISKQNHWLDTTCMAVVAGRMVREERKAKKRTKPTSGPPPVDGKDKANFRGLRRHDS